QGEHRQRKKEINGQEAARSGTAIALKAAGDPSRLEGNAQIPMREELVRDRDQEIRRLPRIAITDLLPVSHSPVMTAMLLAEIRTEARASVREITIDRVKDDLMITDRAISRTTAAVKAAEARAVRSSLRARKSTIHRRRSSFAAI